MLTARETNRASMKLTYCRRHQETRYYLEGERAYISFVIYADGRRDDYFNAWESRCQKARKC